MKKLLLSLGSIVAIATPIATVVACGSEKAIEMNLEFPEEKGSIALETNVSLTSGDPSSLTNAFKETIKQVNEKTPEELKNLLALSTETQEKIAAASDDEKIKIFQSLLQNAINLTYKYALVTKTINVEFNGTTTKSIITVDNALEIDSKKDDFKVINEDNMQSVFTQIIESDLNVLITELIETIKQLKVNASVIEWVKTLDDKNIDNATIISFDGINVTLNDDVTSITQKIKNNIQKWTNFWSQQ